MTSSEDRTQRLTQKLVDYVLLYQDCSDKVKQYGLSNTQLVYNEAYQDWQSDPSNPLVEPPIGDQAKSDAHFAKCDSICALEPQNPHEYVPSWISQSRHRANEHLSSLYKISFACWAGIQVIKSQQLADMPNKEEIIVTASNLA